MLAVSFCLQVYSNLQAVNFASTNMAGTPCSGYVSVCLCLSNPVTTRRCLFTAAPRSLLVCAYVLQWNGGLFIHNVTEAYYYQINSFPDWAVEMHSASNATKHWDYTIRIYDQNNVYNNNGQQKCALDAAGACVQRQRFLRSEPVVLCCGCVCCLAAGTITRTSTQPRTMYRAPTSTFTPRCKGA
jgi:hypothetical protein